MTVVVGQCRNDDVDGILGCIPSILDTPFAGYLVAGGASDSDEDGESLMRLEMARVIVCAVPRVGTAVVGLVVKEAACLEGNLCERSVTLGDPRRQGDCQFRTRLPELLDPGLTLG